MFTHKPVHECFIEALFVIANDWKLVICFSIKVMIKQNGIKNNIMDYYSAVKKDCAVNLPYNMDGSQMDYAK